MNINNMTEQDWNTITTEEISKLSKSDKKKLYDQIPEEQKRIMSMKQELLTQALPLALLARTGNQSPHTIMEFGEISRRYCEEFKCSPIQFMRELTVCLNAFMESSIEKLGVSFDEKTHRVPKHLQKKNRDNHKKMEEERKPKNTVMAEALKKAGVVK
jgi:hypothetical protein